MRSEVVAELTGIGRDLMKPRQHNEHSKAGIYFPDG